MAPHRPQAPITANDVECPKCHAAPRAPCTTSSYPAKYRRASGHHHERLVRAAYLRALQTEHADAALAQHQAVYYEPRPRDAP